MGGAEEQDVGWKRKRRRRKVEEEDGGRRSKETIYQPWKKLSE